MNISVISPSRGQGSTTVSTLLALALAKTQNYTVCLTQTGNYSRAMSGYLGIKSLTDKTRSLTQVIKLLESNAISGDEISDYCLQVPDVQNLQIFDTSADEFTDEDNAKLLKFVIENLNHQVVITDVATEIYDELTQSVLDSSDLVVMVLTQSAAVGDRLRQWEHSNVLDYLDSKGLVYIINQFDPYVEAFRDTTKRLRLRHKRCAKISYNPFIKRTSNMGKLTTILPYILDRDPRVVPLNNDIKECLAVILANLGRRMTWR